MARALHASTATDVASAELHPFLAAEITFDTSHITRAWSGYGDLVIDGHTYLGVGQFGSIGPISETSDLKANGMRLGLSGVPMSTLSNALGLDFQGKPATVYFGTLNDARQIVGAPYKLFAGFVDTMQIDENGETAVISVAIESRLIDMQNPNESLYTDADQQRRFPGDRGFEYVPHIQDLSVQWKR